MRSLLVILPLVAAGCGIGSYNEFRDQLAVRWCERQIRCGEVGASEATTHCGRSPALDIAERGAVDVPEALAEGRMTFHSDAAQACLDAVVHTPCDPANEATALYEHCHAVVSGTVKNGATCWGDSECIGGVCVAPDCGGTCTPYAPPGGPCVKTGGTPDVTCDPSVHFCGDDGTCQHKVHEGQPCVADENCLFDGFCVSGRCGPNARVMQDNVCGTNEPPCAEGLYCTETGVCEPLLDAAAACAKADACKEGMTCESGVCAPWLDVGSACVAGTAAIASGCPATQMCSGGVCAIAPNVKSGPLVHCATDADCGSGLYCSTAGNYCFYVGGINAICQSDHECAPELQCLQGACHTPGYVMCAMSSSSAM